MTYDFYIKSKDDICDAVEKFGFVPLFKSAVPGFSIEENVSPRVWFYGNEEGVWEWKGPVIRETCCATLEKIDASDRASKEKADLL